MLNDDGSRIFAANFAYSNTCARVFRKADFGTDHYLVVSKVRERLSLSKRAKKSLMWRQSISRNSTMEKLKKSFSL